MWKKHLLFLAALVAMVAFLLGAVALKQWAGFPATMTVLMVALVLAIVARFLVNFEGVWHRKWREILGGTAMGMGFVWGALIGSNIIPDRLIAGPIVLLFGGFVLAISTPRSRPLRRY